MHREDIRRVYEWMKILRCIRENWVIVTLVDRVSGRMYILDVLVSICVWYGFAYSSRLQISRRKFKTGAFPIQVFLYIFSTFKVSISKLVILLKSYDKMSNKTYTNSLYEYRSISVMQRKEVKILLNP